MAFCNYDHFAMRGESVVCFHRKAPPPVEHHTIIEDCHGVVYTSPNMAAPLVEYGSWPKKTVTTTTGSATRLPLPPPRQVQNYQPASTASHQVPTDQIFNAVEDPPQMKERVITSTEAAKLYGGCLVTEYGARKPVKLYGVYSARKPSRPN